jgi:hypothetical protein
LAIGAQVTNVTNLPHYFPVVNTFVWKPEQRKWQFVLESKNSDGQWTNFATLDLSSTGK